MVKVRKKTAQNWDANSEGGNDKRYAGFEKLIIEVTNQDQDSAQVDSDANYKAMESRIWHKLSSEIREETRRDLFSWLRKGIIFLSFLLLPLLLIFQFNSNFTASNSLTDPSGKPPDELLSPAGSSETNKETANSDAKNENALNAQIVVDNGSSTQDLDRQIDSMITEILSETQVDNLATDFPTF